MRFLWYKDYDISKDATEYRMKVHVFGNSPLPAITIDGLRRAIKEGANEYKAVQFVEHHFYVDDGLVSLPIEAEVVSLLQRTQESLSESNLRLHKVVSNNQSLNGCFPTQRPRSRV